MIHALPAPGDFPDDRKRDNPSFLSSMRWRFEGGGKKEKKRKAQKDKGMDK
jgi:hypothetical protein